MDERDVNSLYEVETELEASLECLRGYSYGNAQTKTRRALFIIKRLIKVYGKRKEC